MNNISKNIEIYNPSILIDGCRQLKIALSDEQIAQFICYYEMLIEKNKVMNLTAVTQWEDVQTKHYLDSLLLSSAADLHRPLRVLDLGTGAGFPGIPLKIAYPNLEMTLADSLNKRILFLQDVIHELGLSGVQTVHARAEDLGRQDGYRESFDLVVSRAVANLSSLAEYCLPFVKIGGCFISYKAVGVEEELKHAGKAIRLLGGGKTQLLSLSLPCTQMERSFVIVQKEKSTSQKYPRKAGIPSRDPLS